MELNCIKGENNKVADALSILDTNNVDVWMEYFMDLWSQEDAANVPNMFLFPMGFKF